MGLLQKQHHVTPRSGDKVKRAITYKKDKRVGEIYEQRKAKGKNTAKDEPKAPTAPPSSYRAGPRRVTVYELGSVAIP
ncbi:hypothetical protein F2Q69_00060160 [Brassica cretica]|uniref:Uncharacterized protein n=1 Tax=Brassica cretica TaxID=69181 RepID=A0A8S9RAG1_BRACR|nr:hypothetical protein F2Q69_00060160 [Brassica cretica]